LCINSRPQPAALGYEDGILIDPGKATGKLKT
jgi:hypothetical protein